MNRERIILDDTQMRILRMIRDEPALSSEEIADRLGDGVRAEDVRRNVEFFRDAGILIKSKAVINWEKVEGPMVKAMIEVKVTPERGYGFDKTARRIYNFPEVTSCYLLSGVYDILVQVEGKTLADIAYFVAEKLSTLDSVQSTTTHFILKKYKEDGDILIGLPTEDDRLAITP